MMKINQCLKNHFIITKNEKNININNCNMTAQKKILLKEGHSNKIKYNDLNIKTLLYIYDNKAKAHLVDDVSIGIKDFYTDKIIANYYLDKDNSRKVYYTQLYKNYFLTLEVEKDKYYLIIEKAKCEKIFALRDSCFIGDLRIEIKDAIHEWGTTSPNSNEQFSYLHQTLKLKIGNEEKEFSFYDSEIGKDFFIDFGNYIIEPLSVGWQPHIVEMIIHRKK